MRFDEILSESVIDDWDEEKYHALPKREREELDRRDAAVFDRFYGTDKKFIVMVDGEACHFDLSIHVKAQLARRSTKYGFMRNHVLYKLFEYYGRGLKDKPREEALAFSKSYQYGVIVDIFNNETPKRYRLITFLPKGRKRPQPGTPLYLCEWLDYLPYYVVE